MAINGSSAWDDSTNESTLLSAVFISAQTASLEVICHHAAEVDNGQGFSPPDSVACYFLAPSNGNRNRNMDAG